MRTYNNLQVEAALCVWEAMLEMRASNAAMNATWEMHGTVTMRHHAMDIGVWVEAAYEDIRDESDATDHWGGCSYDWEIVPAILSFIEWGEHGPRLPAAETFRPALLTKLAAINAQSTTA